MIHSTCLTCGQENVAHHGSEPHATHRRGKRHRAAVAKKLESLERTQVRLRRAARELELEPEALVEFLNRAAHFIAKANGWKVDEGHDFARSENPRSRQFWGVTLVAYEALLGEPPRLETPHAAGGG